MEVFGIKLAAVVLASVAVLAMVRDCLAEKASDHQRQMIVNLLDGRFQWKASEPLAAPVERPEDFCYSVKDPSVVFYQERWHLFCTIRSQNRSHQIEYMSFTDWKDANVAQRHVLKMHNGYFCAPQVFYFHIQYH